VIAKKLSLIFEIPWVADFRDYWTSLKAEDYFESDSRKHQAQELLDEIKNSSKSVMAVNESVATYVGAQSVITNSYDSKLAKLWRTPANRKIFTIGIFGTISDLTPIEPLLTVLQTVKKNRPEIYSHIRVLQVGQVDAKWLNKKINEFGMEDIFHIREFQTRGKAIELLSEAAMFYVGVSPDRGFGLTTNRIFTLLSSGRPILAYAAAGSELNRIISHSADSFRYDGGRIEEAGRFLSETAEKYLNGDLSIDSGASSVREFSSERMLEKFVTLFNQTLNGK